MRQLLKLANVLLVASLLTAPAWAYPGAEFAKQAKVTMLQARAIALKTFSGKIVNAELEKESGGSGLRYSFDIKNGIVLHEVGVDAQTGKVLENSAEK